MSRGFLVTTCILASVLTAAGLWLGRRHDRAPASEPASLAMSDEDQITARFAESWKQIRTVEDDVAARNRLNTAERAGFKAAGWRFVKTQEPDRDLLALDPSLLGRRDKELRLQIHSNAWTGDAALSRLAEIAVKAEDSSTRYVAIEALGRSLDPKAQEHLMALFAEVDGADERATLIGHLKPARVDDAVGNFLMSQVRSAKTAQARRQAAFPLVMIAAVNGPEETERLMAAASPSERAELQRLMKQLQQSGGVAHHHRPAEGGNL